MNLTNNKSRDKSNNSDSNSSSHNTKPILSIADLTLIALFTAVMAICSWISIPTAVPFTLQTLGVFLACGLLGGKRGTITVCVYLLLGVIGIPVFSGFTGGIGHLLGPTGGYIIGFLFSSLVMWAAEANHTNGKTARTGSGSGIGADSISGSGSRHGGDWVLAVSMVLGLLVCYAFGTIWFVTVYTKSTGSVGIMTALGWCVLPYIIPDAVKIMIALLLCRRLRPAISTLNR